MSKQDPLEKLKSVHCQELTLISSWQQLISSLSRVPDRPPQLPQQNETSHAHTSSCQPKGPGMVRGECREHIPPTLLCPGVCL
ncbi:hypothetical protein DPEC_G00010840 [Dallia pectoralis]|uniref:Uncharacterized protein n=1 Tax=Dallia pectoralis TaxID=75939 RepID=A0ACC2HLE7_DALPE|nr:hypothetical protein DPEC_G00010840 [Dallia pectoralis]